MPSRSAVSRLAPPSTKTATLAVVVFELQSCLGHDSDLPQASWPSNKRRRCTPTTSRRYQALAMASVAGEVPSAAGRDGGGNSGLVEHPAFQRTSSAELARHRGWRHRAIVDAGARHPSPHIGHVDRERNHRGALRLDPRNLAIAKRLGAGRPFARHADHHRAGGAVAPSEKLLHRHIAGAIAALQLKPWRRAPAARRRDRRRGRGEQIAADRAHVAYRRAADRARRRMQESEVALAQDLRQGHASRRW